MKPTPVTDAITRAVTNQKEIDTWETADNKARSDIILSISPSELCHIKCCKLLTKFGSSWQGRARKVMLLKGLLFTKMQEGEHMRDHLNLLFDTNDKLLEMGIEVAEDLLSI